MRFAITADITQKLYESRGYSRDQTLDRHTNQIVVGRPMHPSPPSPFEMIWPGLKLPLYMSKDRHYDIESVPADKKACFVHVGKTAGSTVGCSIGFNLHCSSKVQAPGLFPQYATNMFHSQMYDCDDDSAFFIFVVRHPLDRWISASITTIRRRIGRAIEDSLGRSISTFGINFTLSVHSKLSMT